MFITVVAFIIAILLGLFEPVVWAFNPVYLSFLPIIGGIMVLISTFFVNMMILNPLSQLEQNMLPNLVEFLKKDKRLSGIRHYLFFFVFLSFVYVVVIEELATKRQYLFFLLWLIGFGLALDLLQDTWRRVMSFFNPSYFINHLIEEGKKFIQTDKDQDFWETLDNLTEVTIHSIEDSKLSLSTQAIKGFPVLMHALFASSKSLGHIYHDQKFEEKTGTDEASYNLFYLLQRLELIFDRALSSRHEMTCRQLIISFGKIIIYSAKCDISLMTFPIHFLTKFGLKAQQHHFNEVLVLTTSTLLEIARTVLNEVDLTYAEIQAPFGSIINGLVTIAKKTFKKDKTTSIQTLIQPLIDLKSYFENRKMAQHRDTVPIIEKINSFLSEFEALEQTMRAIPPLSRE